MSFKLKFLTNGRNFYNVLRYILLVFWIYVRYLLSWNAKDIDVKVTRGTHLIVSKMDSDTKAIIIAGNEK